MSTVDVLIAGAGPTGVTMALELLSRNITSIRIVDKDAARSDKSRAIVVHQRTLELLAHLENFPEELMAKGFEPHGGNLWVNRRLAGELSMAGVDVTHTRYPFPLLVSQVETEELLEKFLVDRGVQIERPVAVKSVEQDQNGATVLLAKGDGSEESVRCQYVIGCDGAHSVVRKSANIKYEGEAYPQDFILTDVHMDWDWKGRKDRVHAAMGVGMAMILPLKDGMVRIIASRPDNATDADPSLEDFQEFMHKMLPGNIRLYDPTWLTKFHLHHRGVDKYRDGRLFVAGDAAHIHSPVGGQGMNTGIQDSINLAWKMAQVLCGTKPDSFLDSYHEERYPVGQELLINTDQLFNILTTSDHAVRSIRNMALPWILPWLMNSVERRAMMFDFLSELGIKYPDSQIVGTATGFDGLVRGGYRAPDGKIRMAGGKEVWLLETLWEPSYHLLLFSGTGQKSDWMRELEDAEHKFRGANKNGTAVHIICHAETGKPSFDLDVKGKLHGFYGLSKPTYVYVRPDYYIEHVGHLSALDELLDWLKA